MSELRRLLRGLSFIPAESSSPLPNQAGKALALLSQPRPHCFKGLCFGAYPPLRCVFVHSGVSQKSVRTLAQEEAANGKRLSGTMGHGWCLTETIGTTRQRENVQMQKPPENTTEPDAEAILDEIFKLDAQYQGGLIKTGSRTEFYRLHLCPLLYAAFDAEYHRGIDEARGVSLSIIDEEGAR
jgi:hypothetical protein